MDCVIELLGAATYTEDAAGVRRAIPAAPRQVFAKLGSVTRAEFYNAGRAGYAPAFVFSVFADDYRGESALRYRGESFAIYRTYRRAEGDGSDYIELYAERQAGTDGKGRTDDGDESGA